MKKRVVIQMEGGLGKQIALTSLIPYFRERYDEVIVLSSYPDVFINNPSVYRAISYQTPYAYEEYIKTADDIVYPCGYRDSDFRKRRINLVEAACNSINIQYDSSMVPQLFTTEAEEPAIQEIREKLGSYIIIQSHGAGGIMAKDYDIDRMEEIVREIKKINPELSIVNYSLPKEVEIAGTIKMEFPWSTWFGIMRECETFIAIDSSLQHMSAAYNKKGIVLWGATNPKCYGWDHNVNVSGLCSFNDLHCTRPYFVPSVDIRANGQSWECPTKGCMKIEPEKVLEEFKKLDIDTSRKPTIDFTKYMSMVTKKGE